MHIIKAIIRLFVGGCLVSSSIGHAAAQGSLQQNSLPSNLSETLGTQVLAIIESAQDIPGLKVEEFSILSPEIIEIWKSLLQEGVLQITGTDQEIRPYFVALQGIIEHTLALELQKSITTLHGMIHTPMPATPLCTKGEISPELVDRSIEMDPTRLLTVKARTTIVRDYLEQGGNLYIIYPQDGLLKRTEQQQKIYKEELVRYSTQLFDVPLQCMSIPADLIGATYLFQDQLGNCFVFAIQMTQAKDPQEQGHFGLWFGPLQQDAIQKRVQTISQFLNDNGCPLLKTMINE